MISGLRALLPGFLPPSAGGYTGHLQKFCCVVFSCSVVRCQFVGTYSARQFCFQKSLGGSAWCWLCLTTLD